MVDEFDQDKRSRDLIKSLEKGIAVLRAFSERSGTLTMSEIAEQLDLSRPGVRRILLTLEHLGYTYQHRGVWGLTPRVLELGAGYFSEISLPEIANPYLQILTDAVGETCHVAVWDRDEVVHVARAEVRRILQDSVRVGTRLPAYATALGQVLLTGLSSADLAEFLHKTDRVALTPHTLVDESALKARIEEVRGSGCAIAIEELESGMTGAAVPILANGELIGALGATSTMLRSSRASLAEQIVPRLREAAAQIARSYELSHRQHSTA